MSPSTPHHVPKTSRQAKKDYLKKRANPILSETEIRRLNRDVELHERANRIKTKEQKKKINLKKKEEKLEKEREARKKAGLPTVREKYLSPRQNRLGAFMGLDKRASEEWKEDTTGDDQVELEARRPLQPKSPNAVNGARSCVVASPSEPLKDTYIDYNAQVTKKPLPAIITTHVMPTAGTVVIGESLNVQVEHATDLLELISTQDLQSSDEDSSDTLEAEGDYEKEESDFADAEFEELAHDLDFCPGVCLKQERNQKLPMIHLNEERIRTPKEDDIFFDEFAPMSQDLLDLIEENDFDEFEISTQDIRNLDP